MSDSSSHLTSTTGRIAGVDFGTVRIGLAISDVERRLATPLSIYARKSLTADAEFFRRLVAEEQINLFVVGLPVHLSGRESEKSRQAREFGQWLTQSTGVPVEFFDERFTTSEAEQLLIQAGATKKRRRERLDKLAAQILLTAYLESGGKSTTAPRGLDDDAT